MKVQRLTEDHISLQNDLMVLSKEKDRIQFERDDYLRQLEDFALLQEELKRITAEKCAYIEQGRKLERDYEVI